MWVVRLHEKIDSVTMISMYAILTDSAVEAVEKAIQQANMLAAVEVTTIHVEKVTSVIIL